MKLPTDWQCRHVFPASFALGMAFMFLGLYFWDGWMVWMSLTYTVSTSMAFMLLPEHGDPWN